MKELTVAYSDMERLFRQCTFAYPKLVRDKAFRGKRERGRLHGIDTVWHDTKVDGEDVTVAYHPRTGTWCPVIHVYTPEHVMIIEGNDGKHKKTHVMVRQHAVERYIQRYIHHDENYAVPDDEYEHQWRRILGETSVTSLRYDYGSDAYMLPLDGGAFVCLSLVNDDLNLIVFQTYLTVSMMKANQLAANGAARRRADEMRREIPLDGWRQLSKEQTVRQVLEYLDRKDKLT